MVQAGELGAIRVVQVEYAQDWLATRTKTPASKQAEWRTDPARSGPAGSVGDIGTHAFNLAEFITGDEVAELSADLHTFVEGRPPRRQRAHDAALFDSGAKGMLWCSQVAPRPRKRPADPRLRRESRARMGCRKIRTLLHLLSPRRAAATDPPQRSGRRTRSSRAASRIPAGHPEGYLEGFAQLYTDIAEQIAARIENREPDPFSLRCPDRRTGRARRPLHRSRRSIVYNARRRGFPSDHNRAPA